MLQLLLSVLLLSPLLLAVGCAGDRAREADRAFTAGLAEVESLSVEVHQMPPPAARVVAHGTLPDACTKLDEVRTRRLGDSFEVTLTTRREFGALCAAQAIPYERRISLPIDTHRSAVYLVDVNGVTESVSVFVNPWQDDLLE